MRAVVQRVSRAFVSVEGSLIGEIAEGFVILLAAGTGDTHADADWLAEKIAKLRLFPAEDTAADGGSFMERNIMQTGGSVLVISQFTLYGDCRKGTRPSFSSAALPEEARELYLYFADKLESLGIPVQVGEFGAHMEVDMVNDGPVTLIIDSRANTSIV